MFGFSAYDHAVQDYYGEVDLLAARYVRRGMSPGEARRVAEEDVQRERMREAEKQDRERNKKGAK